MKRIIPLAIIALLVLSGCGSPISQPSISISVSEQHSESQMSGQFGGFSFGEVASWPEYLPEDIPPIPANITMVMADANGIRIFFKDLPEGEFSDYLSLLQKQGFSLQYIVYEQAGMPEGKANEKMNRGEFDAVRIKKGTYSMNIEYGNGQGTFDIDVKGLPEDTVINSGSNWPKELAGILDAPEGCSIECFIPTEDGETYISCKTENIYLFRDYMDKLSSQGFIEGERSINQNGEIMGTSFIKGRIKVELTSYQPGQMDITVCTDAENEEVFGKSFNGGWPQGMPASLPEFSEREIRSTFVTGDNVVKIIIGIEDTTDIQAYRDMLIQSGFVVEDPDNTIFVNADCRVTVDEYMYADFFSITVEII